MLHFFRRIRQRLLTENRFTKYLLYAVGEILLVVIGILIALQVNNWNEQRKLDYQEVELLNDLKLALKSDVNSQFAGNLETIDRSIGWADNILSHIKEGLPYSDNLGESFVLLSSLALQWKPEITTYSNLESGDIKLIKNKSLRTAISRIYNQIYPGIRHSFRNYEINILEYGRPITRSEFIISNPNYYLPLDYENLIDKPEFINTVNILKFNLIYIQDDLNEAKSAVESVVEMIEEELKPY